MPGLYKFSMFPEEESPTLPLKEKKWLQSFALGAIVKEK